MENKIEKNSFSLADFEEEEKWLEYQHKIGWKFIKTDGRKYFFEKCNDEEWIYQLDCKDTMAKDENYTQLFSDCGWEFVTQYSKWFYFRKKKLENDIDTTIYSDKDSKIAMCERILNGRITISSAIFAISSFIIVQTLFLPSLTLLPSKSYVGDFLNAAIPWIAIGLMVATSYQFFCYSKIKTKMKEMRCEI